MKIPFPFTQTLCASLLVLATLNGIPPAQAAEARFSADGSLRTAISDPAFYGSGFVTTQINAATPTQYGVAEHGAYRMVQANGSPLFASYDVTAVYTAYGVGELGSAQVRFVGGNVDLYVDSSFDFGAVTPGSATVYGADNGLRVASFGITQGSGIAGFGAQIQAQAIAGTLRPGYFFLNSGEDVAKTQALTLALDIRNVLDSAPSPAVVAEIICKESQFPGPGCNGAPYSNTPFYFSVADTGQAVLSAVPEPHSTPLLLLGLIGLFVVARGQARTGMTRPSAD